MVKKAVLAQFIRAGQHSPTEWREFMPKVKGLRVKDVGSRGEVQISMDDKGWFSPESWVANYQAEVRERLAEELKIAGVVLPTGQINELVLQHVDMSELHWIEQEEYLVLMRIAEKAEDHQLQRCVNALRYIFALMGEDDALDDFFSQISLHPYFSSNS